jgi:hypothetical protein
MTRKGTGSSRGESAWYHPFSACAFAHTLTNAGAFRPILVIPWLRGNPDFHVRRSHLAFRRFRPNPAKRGTEIKDVADVTNGVCVLPYTIQQKMSTLVARTISQEVRQ